MDNKFNVDTSIKSCLVGALIESQVNLKETAYLTGLSRASCYRYIKHYGINLKEMRQRARGVKLGRHYG